MALMGAQAPFAKDSEHICKRLSVVHSRESVKYIGKKSKCMLSSFDGIMFDEEKQ